MSLFVKLFGNRAQQPAPVSASIGQTLGGRPGDDRPWWDRPELVWPGRGHAPVIEHVVNNRVFLLGLDELYRTAMKGHEREELLLCAERVASALNVEPADVPIEGYYAEEATLTAYFRLMRALQRVPLGRHSEVEQLPQFCRLFEVTSSPIFGPPLREYLLPVGQDPLYLALGAHTMDQWTVQRLTDAAAKIARETDDYSLVGLAARSEDPVALAALRESVVLYAGFMVGCALPPRIEFIWRVDPELSAAAERFVDRFNRLFGRELPPPRAKYAGVFWHAYDRTKIVGRCVRLGQTPDTQPRYYHWAVIEGPDDQLGVREFWDGEIWTTERYRRSNGPRDR